jgi:DNA-binding response OmpR family regulator
MRILLVEDDPEQLEPYRVCFQKLDILWMVSEPESNALTVLVRKFRQRLQLVDADDWIKTVYGMGYRFNPLDNQE